MATTLQPLDAPAWSDFLLKYDAAYRQFMANYNALVELGPYINSQHPELIPQYDALVSAGTDHYNTLLQLDKTRKYVAGWLDWMATGAQQAWDYVKGTIGLEGTLGLPVVAPIIGLAAALAALALITKWIVEAYEFAQRLNALQRLEDQGYTPAQAAAAVNATIGAPRQSSGNVFGIPFELIIWGAIAIFLGPPIIKAITERRGE